MGLFDFFKKKDKEPAYDPTNIQITDLQVGFMLDYDLKSWKVTQAWDYDWGKEYFTKEFKLFDGELELYLSVDANDGLDLSVSRSVKIRSIDEDLPEYIVKHKEGPTKIIFDGDTYYLDGDSAGYCKDMEENNYDDAWAEFIEWEYYTKDESKMIAVSQWDEREFEASIGKPIKAFEISNILPAQNG
ncbi:MULTISPECIES: DUF4178 domain-containing protein [Persicobacter]|uniref:DUF4178 domain-containing protein n=1 Tax=Persicobacter diffluens TaxID=981 RepID=A0AAN4VX71_9BACT|nr:DUF4178 domain-containing protein [Persicobacter sp. CCB-QB2]GJM60889.1 hypothetical protein PEDI_14410 [Persicobacter diffluens]